MGATAGYALIVITAGAAAVLSAVTTPIFAAYASRTGIVVQPRVDRWHTRPTPLLGGLAIGVAVLLALTFALPASAQGTVVLVAGAAALMLGLVDDLRHLAPATKLVGQVAIAFGVYFGGTQVLIIDYAPVSFLLTTLWIVGVMNAINLIDNMDGLAGGVVFIAGTGLGLVALPGQPVAALIAGATAGAALGFLLHNWFPARVFMGDAGSQFLGLMLALAAVLATSRGAANLALATAGPLVVLSLPLLDSALVTMSRRDAGRPISQGGRDHASHRLAALGLSDRAVVLVLYGVTAILAGLGVLMNVVADALLLLAALVALGLLLFGRFLFKVEMYGRPTAASVATDRRERGLANAARVYARFGAHVALDVIALTIACYLAFVLRFEGEHQKVWLPVFENFAPLLVGAHLGMLALFGAYKMLWRYLNVTDSVVIAMAVASGSVVAVAGSFLNFGPSPSAAVFVLDALLATGLLIASRYVVLGIRNRSVVRTRVGQQRVIIVGANAVGAIALQALAASHDINSRTLGFVDDDAGKRYRRLAGVPVLGATNDLGGIIERERPDLVLIALADDESPSGMRAEALCRAAGVPCRRFSLTV